MLALASAVDWKVALNAGIADLCICRQDTFRALKAGGNHVSTEDAFEEVAAGHLRGLAVLTGHYFGQVDGTASAVCYFDSTVLTLSLVVV